MGEDQCDKSIYLTKSTKKNQAESEKRYSFRNNLSNK